jgi:hypothetical protein
MDKFRKMLKRGYEDPKGFSSQPSSRLAKWTFKSALEAGHIPVPSKPRLAG